MKTKRVILVILAAFLVIALAACDRSASEGPTTGNPAGGEGMPSPGELGNAFLTQTAAAPSNQQAQPPTPTAVPVQPVNPTPTTAPLPTPVPTKAAAPTKAAMTVPDKYTLQKGEFPYCIARRFNINPDQLLAANNLSKNAQSFPGQTLTIPQNAKPFPGKRALAAHPTKYTVKAGDTIYSIACAFGDVSPEAIASANSLKKPYTLSVGQTLQIP
ncbi:MAG: LysM domain-containing protein [Anaerolineae bacterium]|nr:MAG: LysM domain-containing protein [Anaerolineae bacterium]